MYKRILALSLSAALLLALAACGDGDSSVPVDTVSEADPQEESLPEVLEEEPAWYEREVAEIPYLELTLEEAQMLLQPGESGVVPISEPEHLVALQVLVSSGNQDHYGQTFQMQNDISLAGMAFRPIGGGNSADDMPRFGGTFDGGNHIIRNLKIFHDGANPIGNGLFGAIDDGGVVQNLHLIQGEVNGDAATGGVAGYCSGTLRNCSFNGTVFSRYSDVGGLCGQLAGAGMAEGCFINSETFGNENTGGLIGHVMPASRVQNCYALGAVTSVDSALTDNPSQIGGFIGRQNQGEVLNCYSHTEVYTQVASRIVGGFIGYNAGSNTGCYYNREATSNWEAIDANLDNMAYDITGCTVEEMLEQSTYQGWDFTAVWGMQDDRARGLPHLRAAWDD